MSETRRSTVQLVANPKAGRFDPVLIQQLARAFSAAGAEVIESLSGPGLPLVIAPETDLLCVVGGDGSVRHVAHAMLNERENLRMCAWPGGTINLLNRDLPKPRDPASFARHALGTIKPQMHHVGFAGDQAFLACASFGPDALAVHTVSDALKAKIGRLAYLFAVCRLVVRWPRQIYHVEIDGKDHLAEAVYIANGRHFAGPWSFAPQSDRTRPDLHFVLLKRARRRDFLSFALALLRQQSDQDHPNRTRIIGTSARIVTANPLVAQLDGDAVSFGNDLEIGLHGHQIAVV